jgi:hypothetical protein
MDDDAQRPEGPRSPAKRALRGAARPFLGYFDRRFQGLHEHLDQHPEVDHLEAVMHGRFEHLLRELRDTRTDVAADTDTIAELAFTLERFADLFTIRMEEIAAQLAATSPSGSQLDASIVQFPFAFAAAAAVERGAAVATVGEDGRLGIGLAALGCQVTAVEPTTSIVHPDVTVVREVVGDWGGPTEQFDAVFALAPPRQLSEARPTREKLEVLRKWLRPSGRLVLGTWIGRGQDLDSDDFADVLAHWDVVRRERFERDHDGTWRRAEDVSEPGVVLVWATPLS